MKGRLLFVVYEAGNFNVAMRLAQEAREHSTFQVVMWSPYCLPDDESYRRDAQSVGSVYISEATAAGSLADIWTPMSGWLSDKPSRLPQRNSQARSVPNGVHELLPRLDDSTRLDIARREDGIRRRIAFCEDIIVRLGIDSLVMAEQNIERDSSMWVAAGRNRGCKTTIVTYGALDKNGAYLAYRSAPAHQVPPSLRPLVQEHLPHWIRPTETGAITRLPLSQALALELAQCSSPSPWLPNAGDLDVIALESEAMKAFYLEAGFSESKLQVVGHPAMDTMAQLMKARNELQRELLVESGFESDFDVVSVALPPDQTDHRPYEFGSFESVQDAFLLPLMELERTAVFVTFHPNTSKAHRDRVHGLGFKSVTGSAAKIIPLSNLYVASVSSTIKWALACGVPVIDYDVYGYSHPDYLGLPSVKRVSSLAMYQAVLRGMSPHERQRWRLLAEQAAPLWGTLDGRAVERIVNLVFGPLQR